MSDYDMLMDGGGTPSETGERGERMTHEGWLAERADEREREHAKTVTPAIARVQRLKAEVAALAEAAAASGTAPPAVSAPSWIDRLKAPSPIGGLPWGVVLAAGALVAWWAVKR